MNPLDLDFLDSCKAITEVYEAYYKRTDDNQRAWHVVDEILEFMKAKTRSELKLEWADIILTTIVLGQLFFTKEEMNEAISDKLIEIKRRVEELK